MKRKDAEEEVLSLEDAVRAAAPDGYFRVYGVHLLAEARYDIFLLSVASNEGMIGDDE